MSSSLTSTSVWDVLSRLGPEDGIVAVAQPNSSPLVTAGADWAVTRGPLDESKLYYKNGAESERFIAMATTPRCVFRSRRCVCGTLHVPISTPNPLPSRPFF